MAPTSVSATHLSNPHVKMLIGPQPATVRGAATHLGKHPKLPKVIYPSGKQVVVRDLENPTDFFVYRGHNAAVTVAKFSPNGYWVASGDATGKVRIWSWDNPEHILKLEVQVVGGGEVKDIDWDVESRRVVAVGEGQGVNAKVFGWDTGTSLGELNGHGKRVICCSYRQGRPGRLVTGSEDTRTVFYKGPPFNLERSNTQHGGWVNCVRYSPACEKKEGRKKGEEDCFVTASSDKRVLVYDGLTGELKEELRDTSINMSSKGGEKALAHFGSIYSLAFSPSGSRLATASADKTIKIWDMEHKKIEATLACAPGRDDEIGEMQNAVLWWGENSLVSLSLNGDVNMLQVEGGGERGGEGGGRVSRGKVLQGHQVTITALAVERERGVFYTSSYDGMVMAWEWKDGRRGEGRRVGGSVPKTVNLANHAGKIVGLAVVGGGGGEEADRRELKSVGFDDMLRTAVLNEEGGGTYEGKAGGEGGIMMLTGQPVAIAAAGGGCALVAVIFRPGGMVLVRGEEVFWSVEQLPSTPLSVAMWGDDEVAVGGEDCKVYIYAVGAACKEAVMLEGPRGQVSALAYSPGGEYLAVGDCNREVSVFARGQGAGGVKGGGGWTSKISRQWVHHTSRITALAWSPTGEYLVSGSLDSHIIVWTPGLDGKGRRIVTFELAHKDGVTVLDWLSEDEVVSSGNDAVICVWDVAGAIAAAVALKK